MTSAREIGIGAAALAGVDLATRHEIEDLVRRAVTLARLEVVLRLREFGALSVQDAEWCRARGEGEAAQAHADDARTVLSLANKLSDEIREAGK